MKLVRVELTCDHCGAQAREAFHNRAAAAAEAAAQGMLAIRGWHISRRWVWCPEHRRRRDRGGGGGG